MHAVDAYEVAQRARGLVAVSIARSRAHLDTLLAIAVNAGRPLRWLTPRRAAELYERVQVGRAPDTHRNTLAVGKMFGAWCAKRGWLAADPFAALEPVGRRRRGKPQLHVDEARRLLEACLSEHSREALAVSLALLLGLRASEIVLRQVRDLDDGGRLLWVPHGKTRNARRYLAVPDALRGHLLELAAGRPAAAYLFGEGHLDRPSRYWVHYHCGRLCAVAKVPRVPPHGLRGTHATLATAAGVTGPAVSAALGHGSTAITESTYVAPGGRQLADQRAALRALDGGADGNLVLASDYQQRGRSS